MLVMCLIIPLASSISPCFLRNGRGGGERERKKSQKQKRTTQLCRLHAGTQVCVPRSAILFLFPLRAIRHSTHTHTQTHSKHCGVYIRKTSRRPFPVQEDNNNNKKVGLPNPTFLSLDNNRTHTILVKKKRRERERRPYQRKIKRRAPLMKTERWRNRWLWGSL